MSKSALLLPFFSFSFYLPIHMKYLKPEGHPPLKFYKLVIWRWLATVTAFFFLSRAYSLVSLAFQINFSGGNPVTSQTSPTLIEYSNPDAYGKGTFPIYWMLNFVGMMALGLIYLPIAYRLLPQDRRGAPTMGEALDIKG